jgi:hypothetical protein
MKKRILIKSFYKMKKHEKIILNKIKIKKRNCIKRIEKNKKMKKMK